jgi:hypothetical protein
VKIAAWLATFTHRLGLDLGCDVFPDFGLHAGFIGNGHLVGQQFDLGNGRIEYALDLGDRCAEPSR